MIAKESCQLTLGSGMPSLHLCHKHKQPIASVNPTDRSIRPMRDFTLRVLWNGSPI